MVWSYTENMTAVFSKLSEKHEEEYILFVGKVVKRLG